MEKKTGIEHELGDEKHEHSNILQASKMTIV